MEYNREELFKKIELLKIEKVGETIVTKYNDRVIKTANVSKIYEIFDIVKYLKEKITHIENNFDIKSYNLRIKGGIQYLELHSDIVMIDNKKYQKSFHILNSSDKSRKLSFNTGLYCLDDRYYIIMGAKNVSLNKRHTTGVTDAAELASEGLNGETFNEQIEAIQSLVGHKVTYSKVREMVLGEDNQFTPLTVHKKLEAFNYALRWSIRGLSDENRTLLNTKSTKVKEIEKKDDFFIDALVVLKCYLSLFNKEDSHIIRTETDRIMNITQWAVRNDLLEMLGI